MLRVDKVSFSYDDAVRLKPRAAGATRHATVQPADPGVLHDVSFEVRRGAVVGLLGPNGSGKTTLLRLAAGVLAPSAGAISLNDVGIAQIPRREIARRIAVVPQETHAAFDYTVLEIVLMGRYPHLGTFEIEGPHDIAAAREALAATGTGALESRSFSKLSGGEKQRVVIASALAQATDVMLLDEPTASLDLRYQLEIGALLRRLNGERSMTMIVSTHDLNFAAAVCHELVLLREGRVLAVGATEAVLTPANIRALYGVDADVRYHERAGHVTVVPVGRI